MGRKATLSYEQVKAVGDALRAKGAKPTIDQVWEALDKVGSRGTIHRLVKRYVSELHEIEKEPGSLRLLPPNVQQVIFDFADQAGVTARDALKDDLLESRQEAASLANENEELAAEADDLRMQLEQAAVTVSVADGKTVQLASELGGVREQLGVERMAAEQARIALATAALRLEALGPLEEELRKTRMERDSQREARAEAERAAAVLEYQQGDHQERVRELKSSLANAHDTQVRLEQANRELAEALERERTAREIAERALAVLNALSRQGQDPGPRSKKGNAQQGALWQTDGEAPSTS